MIDKKDLLSIKEVNHSYFNVMVEIEEIYSTVNEFLDKRIEHCENQFTKCESRIGNIAFSNDGMHHFNYDTYQEMISVRGNITSVCDISRTVASQVLKSICMDGEGMDEYLKECTVAFLTEAMLFGK